VVPPQLEERLLLLEKTYRTLTQDPSFQESLAAYYRDYIGRPSLLYYAKNLTSYVGGAQIYLKREDLNHTGAHK